MATGISVHVGVNRAKPSFQMPHLKGCVKDAEAMRRIAIAHNFEAQPVLADENATFQAVKNAIEAANTPRLKKGDIFLFTFSGHGSTAPTAINEDDGQDETILLHDCVLIDNYFRRNLWSQFDEGVRILGVADCCHGGTSLLAFFLGNVKASVKSFFTRTRTGNSASHEDLNPEFKVLTREDQNRIRKVSPDIHENIDKEISSTGKDVRATILTLASCGDFEKALDGEDNGAFTKAMLEVLCDQAPPPNVAEIVTRIRANLNPAPNYDELIQRIGTNLAAKEITTQHPVRSPQNADPSFLGQVPFTV
jgi:hypothetical protein